MDSKKTSGKAIAALVLGIIGICMPILAPVAVILGIVALNQINKSEGAVTGQGLAIGGIVTGGIACVMIPIMAAIAIPNFIRYQLRSKQSEARLQLGSIKAGAESFRMAENRYPRGDTGWVPPQPCGEQKCTPNPAHWSRAPWSELQFSVDLPHYYQYRYQSDGSSYVIEAKADLDGDGEPGHFRLTSEGGTVEDAAPGEF